jgi:hypothetical protein
MQIPASDHSITALIDKHHEALAAQEMPRPHMGCSIVGHPCDRWLWLSFRFAVKPKFPGRVLRMFRRGRNEEVTIIDDLRAIGIKVRSLEAQMRVDLGSHLAGSVDAILDGGVPGAVKAKHIAEFKTHSAKSFADVVKHGVEKSKPEHFVQMQLYMFGTGIHRALYVAVNKDDDSIYTERLVYDKIIADKYIARGQRIALADRMPEPLSTDPSWYQCKWCPAYSMCHESQPTKEANCRTCAHSTAKPDSTWHCARHDADDIPLEWQAKGCDSHVVHPDMVPWQRKDGPDQWTAIYVIDNREVANGDPDAHIYSSKELLANPSFCALGDEEIEKLRGNGARVVG